MTSLVHWVYKTSCPLYCIIISGVGPESLNPVTNGRYLMVKLPLPCQLFTFSVQNNAELYPVFGVMISSVVLFYVEVGFLLDFVFSFVLYLRDVFVDTRHTNSTTDNNANFAVFLKSGLFISKYEICSFSSTCSRVFREGRRFYVEKSFKRLFFKFGISFVMRSNLAFSTIIFVK